MTFGDAITNCIKSFPLHSTTIDMSQILVNVLNGMLTIQNSNKENLEISVYTSQGSIVFKDLCSKSYYSKALNWLQPGIYLIQISGAKSHQVKKVILE